MPKADPASWQRKPFTNGVPVPYASAFTPEEFERIKGGLVPGEMEDKWFIYYEKPFLFFHRSWTGEPVYRVRLTDEKRGAAVEEALVSEHLANRGGYDANYDALLIDFLISNLLLGKSKPFPVPPEMFESFPDVFQFHMTGTGYPAYSTGMPGLVCQSRVVDSVGGGNILQVMFRGVHEWKHGAEMARCIAGAIIENSPVAGVIINLADYEYRAGDDVSGLFEAFLDRQDNRARPAAIVARDQTHASLHAFMAASKLLDAFRVKFVRSVEDALGWLRGELMK